MKANVEEWQILPNLKLYSVKNVPRGFTEMECPLKKNLVVGVKRRSSNHQKSTNEKIKYYWNETSTGSPSVYLLVAGGSVVVDRVTSPLFAKHHLPLKKGAKHYLPLKT